ncbi:hypothetical protein [Methylotuvimicrobium alcaliphilum]|jgi:hypothetical protein|uniref:Uncharacterized protein n=1 Tax=Methylotuvimicrobium alcaliphilum (strain DSM 19304 / NCIMB 14124 / VKM B-2133 / 20Z) TaxID=1091494 RepID=G4SUJ3_META2|nr:hypothetical protein [Methylotuvimicrobium alcaliphilum]CCE21819.1 protein of unknown function [Methylotuvimicrobium alcaliphilum 20Z]
MSIFKNPDFFDLKPLDLEHKVFLPTRELYSSLSLQLNELYRQIKTVLLDWHAEVAVSAKQFYAHPVETGSQWYAQAIDYGTQMYAQVNEVYFPKVESMYEQTIVAATQLGRQAGEHWQAFYDHPQATVAAMVEPVTNYTNQAIDVAEVYFVSVYSAILDLFDLMLEQPTETLEAVYQNALAALLDIYFQMISSLLAIL